MSVGNPDAFLTTSSFGVANSLIDDHQLMHGFFVRGPSNMYLVVVDSYLLQVHFWMGFLETVAFLLKHENCIPT
jgi:hypothetical protein